MTTDDKLTVLETFARVVAGLTKTKRDDQALDVVSAIRGAVAVKDQAEAGALEPSVAVKRLEAFDSLIAADDEAARKRLRDKFDVGGEG